METILYKPLFINPQAYYVFPNISGRLEPKTGSGKEPAIFVGNIEVKTIAHGDIGKKQYFYNTNEIDLSAFSNSLVRISLYTNRGNVVLGEWDLDIIEGESENYIDPEVLASLVAVCICDGKSNNDPDRAVIKNLVDPDNPFVISNAAYEGMSGHNGYPVVFGANKTWKQLPTYNSIYSINDNKIHITKVLGANRGLIFSYVKQNDQLLDITEIPSFKIKVSGLKGDSKLRYSYIKTENAVYQTLLDLDNGIHKLPKSLRPTDSIVNESWIGFTITPIVENEITFDCDITIEVLPEYEGAFVTDGKDDLITSTKTVKEMLGGSNEVTVVSMVHQIGLSSLTTINNIRSESVAHVVCRNICSFAGKTGIYGYSRQINTNNPPALINNILGDKKDYTAEGNSALDPTDKFFVQGYKYSGTISEVSPIAYYWTFIANKVLTTDQINQVISYFNLDKHVKPDVYYDIKKQGLSNDTPEADWYLKDFSGNGHDMTLYNFAKKLGSGIGKYEVDFNTWIPQSYVADSAYTSNKLHITNIKGGNAILYTKKGANAMKVKITGIQSFNLVYRYIAENDVWEALKVDRDGIYELPASTTTTKTYYTGFTVPYYTGDCDITIEQIPDYEGALVSDGIDDYGKVENLPIYKDYTVVADREIVDGLIDNAGGGVAIRSYNYAKGAFGFDWKNQAFSFGGNTDRIIDVQRFISYQSKYINNGIQLITGNVVDNNPLYMARLGEENRYSKLALWSFLLFPYSLSEFLLERQLKKYKLGTLYPGMIEWRPKVNINVPVVTPPTFSINNGSNIITNGQYIPEGTEITIRIFTATDGSVEGINEATAKINGVDIELTPSGNKTYYGGKFIISSKQKIDITIDEYIRFEDIVQPYPMIVNLSQDGKSITWGDKLKVGSEVTFVNHTNLLPDLYTVSGGVQYNGTSISWNTSIRVEKSMVFVNPHSYKKANEPNCILAPQTLRIPNSSYKILGYIPDLTGKGNHGRLNNFAYTEESGANEDGSIRFDGTDDHIIIPTIKHGGKALLMKVNWRYKNNIAMAYDQRINWGGLGISISRDQLPLVAYKPYNKVTYIDGIKNESVLVQDLEGITHNITGIYNNLDLSDERDVCISRTSDASNSGFADMSMYEFMLFPDVPNEEEIKELNECVGIEGNVWGTLTQLINSTLISNETLIKNE